MHTCQKNTNIYLHIYEQYFHNVHVYMYAHVTTLVYFSVVYFHRSYDTDLFFYAGGGGIEAAGQGVGCFVKY